MGGLSGMHLVFAATNDTTNESVRRAQMAAQNWGPSCLTVVGDEGARRPQIKRMNATETTPYSAGVISNLGRFFCGPQAPSYIDRRGLLV